MNNTLYPHHSILNIVETESEVIVTINPNGESIQTTIMNIIPIIGTSYQHRPKTLIFN